MSGTVDTRTVEMRFDNSNFETNVKQSMSTLEKLKVALKLDGASAGLREVEKSSEKLNFRDLNKNIDGVGKHFNILETIATGALLKIGASAAETGIKIAKSLTIDQVASGWNKYAEKTTAVQTIMANIVDEEGQFIDEASKMDYVNKYLNKLLWFSDETSYSFTDMTSNVGKFIANGQGLEDSVTAMQGIATWAAVSGQNAQVASRAMYNISQALGTGSMKIKDWMSIENANMATAQFKKLAITVGQKKGKIKEGQVTVENFRESLSGKDTNGWFDKEVMMEVFQTYGEAADRIQEYAEAHNVTSTEAIREIKKTDKEFADSLGFKAFAAAQEAKTFGEVVSATADAVSTKWMRIFENIFGDYLQAKELWTELSEDMWTIFAGPLDVIGEITDAWNQGVLKDGPKSLLESWFNISDELDNAKNGLGYVSKEAAESARNLDPVAYKIETLSDGSQRLIHTVETAPGVYKKFVQKIYDSDKDLLSGRDLLIDGFRNILRTFIFDWEDADGEMHLSLFSTIKNGLKEVIFGTSDMEEIIPRVTKKLWEMTKRFNEFSKKLLPTKETLGKIKNAFKGLFTLFKIGGKLVTSIIKPFKNLFGSMFKNAPKTILDLADSLGVWVQKLDAFLDKNKVFDKISQKVAKGLDYIKNGLDKLSVSITGKTIGELAEQLKTKVLGYFENFNFEEKAASIKAFFDDISAQIKQVIDGDLPENLTTFQKFLLIGKKIFTALKTFFKFVASVFSSGFESAKKAFADKDFGAFFSAIWDTISDVASKVDASGIVSSFLSAITNIAKGLFDFVSYVVSNFTSGSASGVLKIVGIIVALSIVMNAINSLISVRFIGRKANWVLDQIYVIARGVSDFMHSKAFEAKGNAAKSFALAVLSLAASIYILGSLDKSALLQGFVSVGIILAIVALFGQITKKLSINSLAFGISLLPFAVAVGILGAIAYALGSIDQSKLNKGIISIAILTLIFGLFRLLVGKAVGINMLAVASAFAMFSIAIGILAVGVKALGKLSVEQLAKGVISISILTLIFGLFRKLVGKAVGINLIAITTAFAIFSVAMDILAIGVKALGKLRISELAKGVVAIGLLTLIFGLFRKLVGKAVGINLIAVVAAFAIFSVAMDTLAIGVKALGKLRISELAKGVVAIGLLTLIFGLFRKLVGKAVGINLIAVSAAFGIFAVSIDILAIGVQELGKLSVGQLAKSIIAIGLLTLIFGLIASLPDISLKSIAGFLVFAATIYIVSAALNKLIPVMQQIESMGDNWWKPLVFFAGAIALVVAAGAISGITPVTIGLLALSAAIIAIGAACLLAGLGIGIAVGAIALLIDSFALLMKVIAEEGPQFAENFGTVLEAILRAVIDLAPLFASAGQVLITALAIGIARSAGALAAAGVLLVFEFIDAFLNVLAELGPRAIYGIINAINSLADAIRDSAPLLVAAAHNLMEALIEAILVGIAGLIAPFGKIGQRIAKKITSWIPGLRDAFNVAGEAFESSAEDSFGVDYDELFGNPEAAAAAGEEDGWAYVRAAAKAREEAAESENQNTDFSGGGADHSFANDKATATESAYETGKANGEAYSEGLVEGLYEQYGIDPSTMYGSADSASKAGIENGEAYSSAIEKLLGEHANDISVAGWDLNNIDLSSISGGVADFAKLIGIDGFDMSSINSMLGEGFGGIDMSSLWGGKSSELVEAIQTTTASDVTPAAEEMASAIEQPITSLNANTWGADIGSGLANGLLSKIPEIEAAANATAETIHSILGFSEPEEGPLSDFHTYAPDMIKLWNKGIYDNIGSVRDSSMNFADNVYDGFSTALDYVSDLIDNGMSDQLTIRPIMDLSEIQNGMDYMSGMFSSADGYQITGTTRLAASAAYGIGVKPEMQQTPQIIQSESGPMNNTFYITNSDPNAVADKVSKILGNQTRRQKAVWGYK